MTFHLSTATRNILAFVDTFNINTIKLKSNEYIFYFLIIDYQNANEKMLQAKPQIKVYYYT